MTSFPDLQQRHDWAFPIRPVLNGIRSISKVTSVCAGVLGPGRPCYSLSPTKCVYPSHPPFQLESVLWGVSHILQGSMSSSPPPLSFLCL